MKYLVSCFLVASAIFCGAACLAEDCKSLWDNAIGQPGMNSSVHAFAVFDDGTGPALYAGGQFTTAGGVTVNRVAKWDGVSWLPIGDGMNNHVLALAVFDDGSGPALYAGGRFTSAGGVSANRVAKWDGSGWSPLSSGLGGMVFNDAVYALTVFDDGSGASLYAGGQFTIAGFGTIVNRIAKWDGKEWSAVGNGGLSSTVRTLTVFDDGAGPALFAGGDFTTALELGQGKGGCYGHCGGQSLDGCWCDDFCCAIGDCCDNACDACGECQVGGQCDNGLNVNYIAKWDGSSWSALDGGFVWDPWWGASVNALVVHDGVLIAGGNFHMAGTTNPIEAYRVAKWDGASWSMLGSGMDETVHALAVLNHNEGAPVLFAGGAFNTAGNSTAFHIARWDGQEWSPLGNGTSSNVYALTIFDSGDGPQLYVGGQFTTAGDEAANWIARWYECPTLICASADLNCDGIVNVTDLLILLSAWGPCGDPCPADLNGDNTVNVTDLLALLQSWG